MERGSRLPWTLLLVGLAVLAGVRLWGAERELPPERELAARPCDPASHARLEELEERLARLEEGLEELVLRVSSERTREVPATSPVPGPETAPAPIEPPSSPAALRPDLLETQGEAALERLRGVVLDPLQPSRDRVVAGKDLWWLELRNSLEGAVTDEVVDAQLLLLGVEEDPALRRQICFNVLGKVTERHAAQLVETLDTDVDPGVRAQAADTLQHLQSVHFVRAALEWASRSDVDREVRETAAEMLTRYDPDAVDD